MKFLITGANGQLGQSLKKISERYPAHSFLFTDLPECDITDRAAMEAMVENLGPDIIVNCAAYTAVDRAESNETAARRVNALGPVILTAIARDKGIKLIHISTDYIFDGAGDRPLTENDNVNPMSVYGRSKLAGERAVIESGCDAVVIRTGWLYSEFGSNFVKTMLRLAQDGETIRVVDDQYGTPTYADDLASVIIEVAERQISGLEVYHYSNGGQTSWYGFAKEIFRQATVYALVYPITTAEYPTAARRPAYSVLSKNKIEALGVSVPPWEESLSVCLGALGVLKD